LSGDIGILNDRIDNAYDVGVIGRSHEESQDIYVVLDGFSISEGNVNGVPARIKLGAGIILL
jgi:hypothetical protein